MASWFGKPSFFQNTSPHVGMGQSTISSSSSSVAICWSYCDLAILKAAEENKLWEDIRKEAEEDPVMQKELERIKVRYYLKKKHNEEPT